FGVSQTTTAQASSVALIPLTRFNAILLAAPQSRIPDIKREIDRLDRKTSPDIRAKPFKLKKMSARVVAGLISNFWSARPRETNQIRTTFDDSSNTVFVQASPGDMADIQQLVWLIDSMPTGGDSKNELRIIPLRQAVADELATLLLRAITDGVVPSTAA